MFSLKKKETGLTQNSSPTSTVTAGQAPAQSTVSAAASTMGRPAAQPTAARLAGNTPPPVNRPSDGTLTPPLPTAIPTHLTAPGAIPVSGTPVKAPAAAPTVTPTVASGQGDILSVVSSGQTASNINRFAPPEHHKSGNDVSEKSTYEVTTRDTYEPHVETRENGERVFKARSVADVDFADCWYTPEKIIYIRDKTTRFALIPFETEDMEEFYRALEQGYTGASSFALQYAGESYRVERVITVSGVQYNCRKMPKSTPNLYKLGIPDPITKHLATLATESGLILFGGPTGMGKTTTASALMKEFLENHGGFLYTIEDPPEMPLDGLYHAKNGALGLCKQSPVENEHWEAGLKSALRSKPRYILVGEIRSPEVASQTLRAATSGHLVLSTIHATSVEDALNSIIKYAMGAGLDQQLVCDLLARGILAVVHQKLEGTTTLHPVIQTVFANPNPLMPDQLRSAIREGRISLGTLMEAQSTRLFKGASMFKNM